MFLTKYDNDYRYISKVMVDRCQGRSYLTVINIIEPRSDRRDLLAIKVKSEIFTENERPSCCEQLQKI